eukprot:TRINITY_DN34789_c0_g1_i1.p1 TRINITY_DN34789_c0_g1~~TRINITY_DN34789_c0_g1_i1.p1  ORF type:complete len:683 (-),score=77.44 TRINITY_DN34789_c0_g1_i1:276-2324(-)
MEVKVAVSHLQLGVLSLRWAVKQHTCVEEEVSCEVSRIAAEIKSLATVVPRIQEYIPASLPAPEAPEAPESLEAGDWWLDEERTDADAKKSLDSMDKKYESEATKGLAMHKERLINLFHQIDTNGSGAIGTEELRQALRAVNEHPARARRLLHLADSNGDGLIEYDEWEATIDSMTRGNTSTVMNTFLQSLAEHTDIHGKVNGIAEERHPCCMLSYKSPVRICWDLWMLCLLAFMIIVTPFKLAFDETHVLERQWALTDIMMDCCFLFDVILNFRTTFSNRDGLEVTDGWTLAKTYMCSWFLLDFLSSVPFEHLSSGFIPSLGPLKLLKIAKIIKIIKLVRVAKIVQRLSETEIAIGIDEVMVMSSYQSFYDYFKILVTCCLLCHLLACFMHASGPGFLDNYDFNGQSVESKYIACLYWAMTTMTTVGYGDITPVSDYERLYAMLAMAFGGGFYGYVIGNISNIVAHHDMHKQATKEKLRLVKAWLQHRNFPKLLQRRLWFFFKAFVCNQTALDETSILRDLSPELRTDVADYLLLPDVRNNLIFYNLPTSAIVRLVLVQQHVSARADERITTRGDLGSAMFIITEGTALMEGTQSCYDMGALATATPPWGRAKTQSFLAFELLHHGDSFGEEFLLGMKTHYEYTVTSQDIIQLCMIPVEQFLEQFAGMPDIINMMRAKFRD